MNAELLGVQQRPIELQHSLFGTRYSRPHHETRPRHLFVPSSHVALAYSDEALQIDCNQTISQPYMVAVMTELLELEGSERVLEVGTGSGYQAAILASLCSQVYSIERHGQLSATASTRLTDFPTAIL